MTKKARTAVRTSPDESANPDWVSIGARLVLVRGRELQSEMANKLGVHKNTYARWERGERELGVDALAGLVRLGWSANWLVSGLGAERLSEVAEPNPYTAVTGDTPASQEARTEAMKIAVEMIDSELARSGRVLPPGKRAEAYMLVSELLLEPEQDLPSAKIIQFAIKALG